MRRRRVLQMGAALATLPLASCAAPSPEPKLPPADVKDRASEPKAPAAEPARAVEHDAAATASNDSDKAPDAGAGPVEAPPSSFARVVGRVGKNHGHVLTVAFADVTAGAEKAYDMKGTAGHPHTVVLSVADMKTLLTGQALRTKSSLDKQHAHRVLVRCAPAADPPEWVSACEAKFSGQDEHELVIPAADLAAPADRAYDVQGIAGHAHQLQISAEAFQKLARGEALSVKTSRDPDDAHLHVVIIQRKAPAKT